MKTASVIRTADVHANVNAYRTATKEYYMVYVFVAEGEFVPCLLTDADINKGIDRASRNREDIKPLSLFQFLYHKTVAFLKLKKS